MTLKPVENWKQGWRWFSTWSFALIVFFATTPLPPEVVSLLPAAWQKHVIALVALCGLVLRFIQQGKVQCKDGQHD